MSPDDCRKTKPLAMVLLMLGVARVCATGEPSWKPLAAALLAENPVAANLNLPKGSSARCDAFAQQHHLPSSICHTFRLRGGADEEVAEKEAEVEEAAPDEASDDKPANPLIPEMDEAELQEQIQKTLQDPQAIKQMFEMMQDPEFVQSLSALKDQIANDPQFQQIQQQAQAMMQDPEVVKQMQQAFSDMASEMPGAPAPKKKKNNKKKD